MSGASNNERLYAAVAESTAGTTPATPSFKYLPFDVLTMNADPRITENMNVAHKGQRSSLIRNGIAVTGSASGPMIYGEYDDFFASLFQASWSSDVLVNSNGSTAMTIEERIPAGEGGTLTMNRFRGVEAVGGSISLSAGEKAAVSFDLLGIGSDDSTTTAITGSSYAAVGSVDALGSNSDIGVITMSGISPLSCMRNLTIDFGVTGKDEQPKLSSDDLCGITRGALTPQITGEFYVEDSFLDVYNAARSGTEFALVVPIGSTSGEKYSLNFPKCQFSSAKLQTGESGPAFQPFTILPYYDSGIGGTVELTRAIS